VLIVFLMLPKSFAVTDPLKEKYLNFLRQTAENASFSQNQASESFIETRVGQAVGATVGLIGVIFLFLTVFSGLQWMTAGGNEETVTKARKRVINGAIGVGITLCAFLLTNLFFTYFEGKFLSPAEEGNVIQPPSGWNAYPCDTNSDCEGKDPQTICSNGLCVQCINDDDCGEGFTCSEFGLCLYQGSDCSNYHDNPQGCMNVSGCIYEKDAGQSDWEKGTCFQYDPNTDHCFQCLEDTPYCINDGNGYRCVQCNQNSECPTFLNSCRTNVPSDDPLYHTCVFGNG